MIYVLDTNTLTAIFRHYFYDRFPSFWENFNALLDTGRIASVREVRREIEALGRGDILEEWTTQHPEFYLAATAEEARFVSQIYQVSHFQQNLERKKRLKGGPFADPFLIAAAKARHGTVVTQEQFKENAARIPNICHHFGIKCTDLQGFLELENWTF